MLLTSLAALAHGAISPPNLTRDLELFKTKMHIVQMAQADLAYGDGLAQMIQKGYDTQEIMSQPLFGEKWKALTRENAQEMKKIIAKWGWPSAARFDRNTERAAYLIVEHAEGEITFQEKCLELLAKHLENRETDPGSFAELWDRVKLAQHLPQRYATQGACRGKGLWEPAPLEDPAQINHRRRVMGLTSLEDSQREHNQECLIAPNEAR